MILRFCLLVLCLSVTACAVPQAKKVVVQKSSRTMILLDDKGQNMALYRIALGKNPVGPKLEEGDYKTPEGEYRIAWRNARSKFHKSLAISYPSDFDMARARAMGVRPGNHIMIHGLGDPKTSYRRNGDWTEGCIAVSNAEIEQIWRSVPDGTPIVIVP